MPKKVEKIQWFTDDENFSIHQDGEAFCFNSNGKQFTSDHLIGLRDLLIEMFPLPAPVHVVNQIHNPAPPERTGWRPVILEEE